MYSAEPPLTYQPACKPGSVGRDACAARVTAIPLGRRLPGASSNLPGRRDPDIDPGIAPVPSLFGLAPGGVCRAAGVAAGAVRSYRTFSPLPRPTRYAPRRSALCGTVPEASPREGIGSAGRYPAPYVHGARTFLPGGLSALAGAAVRPTDEIGMGPQRRFVKGTERVWLKIQLINADCFANNAPRRAG